MSFTSLTFAIFLGVMLLGYYLIPKKVQWLWLLIGSYVFYTWSSPYFVVFLLFSTVTTWAFPLIMGRLSDRHQKWLASEDGNSLKKEEKKAYRKKLERQKRILLILCLICNIGLLAFLKYTNFVIVTINHFGVELPILDWLVLPLGISFYTFQSVGYVVDVYRETALPLKNFFKYALYVSFFPQICQGPIGRFNDLAPQLYSEHRFEYNGFIMGLERILLGFFKKMVVADQIAVFVNAVYQDPSAYSGLILGLATLMYAFQLYADFSGYMDIAIGAGRCFGIRLAENFETPYFSRSITEFWRRWHITLGSWFKDYLYYPVLRSGWCSGIGRRLSKKGRKKAAKMLTTVIGLAITWLLIGMWHGASWNFILYGCYHGAFVIMAVVLGDVYEKIKNCIKIREENKIWQGFQIVRTFFIVTFGYVLFRSADISQAALIYKRLFTFSGYSLNGLMAGDFNKVKWIIIIILLLLCFVMELIGNKKEIISWLHERSRIVRWLFLYVLVALILLFANWNASGAGNFIYFNF